MDRDPRENVVDPIERHGPTTGDDDTGDTGDQSVRIHRKREERGTEPDPADHPKR